MGGRIGPFYRAGRKENVRLSIKGGAGRIRAVSNQRSRIVVNTN